MNGKRNVYDPCPPTGGGIFSYWVWSEALEKKYLPSHIAFSKPFTTARMMNMTRRLKDEYGIVFSDGYDGTENNKPANA